MGALAKNIVTSVATSTATTAAMQSGQSQAAGGQMSTKDFVAQMQASQMTDDFQKRTQEQIDARKKILEGGG